MFVILNTHHEYPLYDLALRNVRGTDPVRNTNFDRANDMLAAFWRQIADRFRDYDGRLIFEGLNEPRDRDDSQWYGYGSNTTPDPRSNILYARINILNQTFVTTVRSRAGNNPHRILMMPAYAASGHAWNSAGPLDMFQRPNDPANPSGARITGKLILSVHRYEPQPWTLQGQANDSSGTPYTEARIQEMIERAFSEINSRASRANVDMPVILGEWGTTNAPIYDTAMRARYAEFYVREAHRRGFRTVVWDNGASSPAGPERLGLFDRSNATVFSGYGTIITAIRRGAGLIP
jgi:endoglucanase